jgi:hypothetical protein
MSDNATPAHETPDQEQAPAEVNPTVTVESANVSLRIEVRRPLRIPRPRIPRPSERTVALLGAAATFALTVHQHVLTLR